MYTDDTEESEPSNPSSILLTSKRLNVPPFSSHVRYTVPSISVSAGLDWLSISFVIGMG